MAALPIPVYAPTLGPEERGNVEECLRTNWISSKGRFIADFEAAFAAYVGAGSAVSVCNGTVALHLALLALDIGPGMKVAVPTLAYVAAVNCIRYVGAEPVFVDVDPISLQISSTDLERKAERHKLAALVVVHTYGQPSDMGAIKDLAAKFGFAIVEDCAEAFGARVGDRHVGADGQVATYSFYGNKTITTGEGGMVTTNDPVLDRKIRQLRGQGLSDCREYWHEVVGYNYRMTNICAAIGLAQIRRAGEFLARKRAIAMRYKRNLVGLPLRFHDEMPRTTHSFWMCSIVLDEAGRRDALRGYLRERRIETRPLFPPVHLMPMYRKEPRESHPIAEAVSERGISLPSFPGLHDDQVDFICGCVREFLHAA